MFGRQKIAALVAEFLGAGVLTLLVLSVQRSTIGVPFFVALAAGLTVAVMMFAVGGTSGGHFNPALTIGMWTARRVTTLRMIVYVAAQMLGAWAAYGLYTYYVHNSLQSVGGHYTGRILIAEAVGTGIFAFAWAAVYFQRFSLAVRSSVSGLAYTVGIISASAASIGLLNPSLALGVRAWVWTTYVLGPVVGAIIGVNLYHLLFTEEGIGSLTTVAASSNSASTTTAAKKPAKKASSRKKK